MTAWHAPIFKGEELELAGPPTYSMSIQRMCGCVITFRSVISAKACRPAHTLHTEDRVTAINVDEIGGVLAEAKCGCRYFLFDQVVIRKCAKA